MRALLLVAAVALPAISGAQVADGVLQPVTGDEFVNLGQCKGTDTTATSLVWNTHVTTVFATGGTYRLFASNTQPSSSGSTNVNYCPETDNTATGVRAGQVGQDLEATTQSVTASKDFSPLEIARAAGYATCDATSDKTIYLCIHWYDAHGARNGWANGTVKLSLTGPAAPTAVWLTPGDSALNVAWSAGTGGAVDASEYSVVATTTDARDPAGTHSFARTNGTSYRATGLVNGVTYSVVVYAYSKAGNPSAASTAVSGTPLPVANFWDVYRQDGGAERGGCASGPGGALALLGTAALFALARRKK